jgi:nucleoside-diphosphate-sugar epimerase
LKRVMITGVSGFIGRHAFNTASARHDVLGIARMSSDLTVFDHHPFTKNILRISQSSEILDIIRQYKPEVVIHAATHFLAEHRSSDLDSLIDGNLRFGLHLLDGLVGLGACHIINFGTTWQHYNAEQKYAPVNLYSALKQGFEDICLYYSDATDIQVTHLKLYDTFGPLDPRRKFLQLFIEALDRNEEFQMSAGEQRINLLYIHDLCSLLMSLIEKTPSKNPGHFRVLSSNSLTLSELVEELMAHLNIRIPINRGFYPYRVREVFDFKHRGIAHVKLNETPFKEALSRIWSTRFVRTFVEYENTICS